MIERAKLLIQNAFLLPDLMRIRQSFPKRTLQGFAPLFVRFTHITASYFLMVWSILKEAAEKIAKKRSGKGWGRQMPSTVGNWWVYNWTGHPIIHEKCQFEKNEKTKQNDHYKTITKIDCMTQKGRWKLPWAEKRSTIGSILRKKLKKVPICTKKVRNLEVKQNKTLNRLNETERERKADTIKISP